MKKYYLILIFSYFSISVYGHVENKVDWKSFLSKHDLVWDQTPDNYFNAPFFGNGNLGTMLYCPNNGMYRLDIGCSQVLEHQTNQAPTFVRNGRLPIGYFEFASNYKLKDMKGRLDIYNAEGLFTLKSYYQHTMQVRLKVLRGIDLIVLDYQTDNQLNGYWMFRPLPSAVPRIWVTKEDGRILNPPAQNRIINGVQLSIQERLAGGSYITAWKEFPLTNGWKRLIITVKDNYPNPTNPQELVKFINQYANENNLATEINQHQKWWNNYYTKSFISIPHPQMESLYWGLQYKLASMIRKNGPFCDLMGPWYKDTSWPGVWMNLNSQMLYSSFHIANQMELASTLPDYIHSVEKGLINCVPPEFRHNSAGLPRCTGREQIDEVFNYWSNTEYPERSNLIYLLYYVWEQYRMSMDDDYLRVYYPLLKRAVNFLLNVVETDEKGYIHTPKSHSPESTNGKDTNYDLSSLKWGCQTLLKINQRLGLKDTQRKEWEYTLKHLIDFPVDENGYMAAAGISAPLMHRHWCHLFQIYPYYLVNYENPKEHETIIRSITHWGNPQIPNTWTQAVISSIYSSIGMPEKALEHMNLALATKNLSANMTHSESNYPCSETYGGLSRMLLDMLIQSWGDKIRIFPGVGKQWQDAVFDQLRAEGGFLVSASRKNGSTEWIEIESLAGEPCIVEHNFKIPFKIEGCKMKKLNQRTVRLYLKKGEKAFLYCGNKENKTIQPINIKNGKYNFYGWPDRRVCN
jgi:alpha-L-fucosidase 2